MNFCIKEKAFLKAGGYDENLGPKGDRPETAHWHRLGAEESDLAIRIWLRAKSKVVYDPGMVFLHKLRPESIFLSGLIRRAKYVGHNRAYIHRTYPITGALNDWRIVKALVKELALVVKKFLRNPVRVWKSLSFTIVVASAFSVGFLEGSLHYRYLSSAVGVQ
jgi:hypothetical protein